MQVPGLGTEKSSEYRNILASEQGALFLPGGKIISGAHSRDPGNTGDVDVLRAGTVLGKRAEDGKYAPTIIGHLTAAATATDGTLTTTAAAGDEVARRIAAGIDTFKVIGPPTDGGVVATANAMGIASEAAGVITLAANTAVSEVQTSTLDALMTAGTFTITYKGETTADIDFDATVAEITAALELLPSVSAGDITMQAAHEPDTELTCTWTFANTLGDVPMLSINITKATGPTSVAIVETTKGELVGAATIDVDMAIGSIIVPDDGSETPLTLVTHESGIKVTDEDGADVDVQTQVLVGGIIDASQIVEYPIEESTRQWLKNQLNTDYGHRGFVFDDDF